MIRFDPFAVPPPPGDWDYVVDDRPIRRAARGSPRLLARESPFVRLAPSSCHLPWRNEHLTVFEDLGDPPTLHVRGSLYLHPRGDGADLLEFEARVRDPAGEREECLLVAEPFRDRARQKLRKALEWYLREIERREKGFPAVLTSREYWRGEAAVWARAS